MKTKSLIYIIICTVVATVFGVAYAGASPSVSRPFTVVIDPGHGGKDPGAQDNGIKEKDINLAVALKLEDFIKKNLKGVKVVMTRDKDEYLTLQQRADKANKAGGNLFISIHVNSADASNPKRTSAAGASTHVIGQNKDRKNADVVRRENSVIKLERNYAERYQGFDPDSDESYIIFEMIQKRFQERSLDMAQEVQKQLKEVAGRRDRGVTQEPFWVLWSTSMPAVLVEIDFICNPNSAKYIASNQGQNKIAKALFNAVRTYYAQEQALARRSVETNQAPVAEPADGRTYFSDEYAIIGATAAPERRMTDATVPTRIERRAAGQKRRNQAARLVSAKTTREQSDIRVRTNEAPAPLSARPRQARDVKPPVQTETETSPAPTKKKKAEKAKKPKSNRKRGTRAVVVPATATRAQAPVPATAQPKPKPQAVAEPESKPAPQPASKQVAKTDVKAASQPRHAASATKKPRLNHTTH